MMAALVAVATVTLGVTASADPVDDYVRSQLAARHLPGVALAVVRDGRIVKTAGYGVASLELRVPVSPETVFEIGSISKQFAADAILLLVEDGKVALDDPISKYLTRTPPAWSAITIRHILTHTSGLADFDSGNIGFSYRREYTADEFVELLGAQPLAFPPGERWNYTNAFPLLGIVVERASGMSYTEFVRARIFAPLELRSARFKSASEVVPHRADGYLFTDGAYRRGEPLRPQIIAPNGGILIDVADFAAWDIAITSHRLLRPESLAAMTTPARLADGRTVGHGLGWFLDTFNGHHFGAHWGSTVTGHSAVIRRYVDDRVTVIMLANLDDGGVGIDAMSRHIAGMYVPGADIHSLPAKAGGSAARTAEVKAVLASIGNGVEHPQAPGLATRLPAPVRARIATAMQTATTFEWLGDETLGPRHFNADPTVTIAESVSCPHRRRRPLLHDSPGERGPIRRRHRRRLTARHNRRPRATHWRDSMSRLFRLILAASCIVAGPTSTFAAAQTARASQVKVTVLSTMLVGDTRAGIGEWGFAAVLEVDGRRLLIDTGARAETVLNNATELKVDLASITDLVITHNHGDHTGGLLALRRTLARQNPQALSRVHVPKGIFYPRPGDGGREGNGLLPLKAQYEATGGVFIEHAGPAVLLPGVTMLGPVPRVHPERNWSSPRGGPAGRVQTPEGLVEDTVPEDTSIVVDTADGLVLISGCGHAGIVNAMEYARTAVRSAPIVAAIGGFHLFAASDDTLTWTAGKLKAFGVQQILGAHCTGIEAVYRLRQLTGLTRTTALVAGVGATYVHGTGIDPMILAR